MKPIATILHLHDALNADGEPRAALLVPAVGRRPALTVFATISAAIAAKRALEGTGGSHRQAVR
jgi:hypothetical protein